MEPPEIMLHFVKIFLYYEYILPLYFFLNFRPKVHGRIVQNMGCRIGMFMEET